MSCKFYRPRKSSSVALLLCLCMMTASALAAGADPFFSNLFKVYTPRSVCMFYEPGVIWLHLISDSSIALAYLSIPFALLHFVRKRTDLAFHGMFLCFAVFILACGATHVMNIVALWHPVYRLDGIIKVITAVASIGTAIMLWPLIPRALALPRPAELRQLNRQLSDEIEERHAVERQLKISQDELERRVEERTAQLREANQRVTSILESITDCFCAVDRDWRYTYINAKAEAYFGLPKESMLGKIVWELFPQAVGTPSYQHYQSAMASGEATHLEIVSPVSHHWLAIHIYPSADGLAFFWEDIHVRKQTEEALAQVRERFDAFIQNSPAPAWIKDERGIYVFMNRAAELSIGASPGAWKDASDEDLLDPEVAQALKRNDQEALASSNPIEAVEIVNGQHLLVKKFSIRGVGDQRFVGGTAIDITDRIAREVAERDASQHKDRFLAILSHELRNPLNAIRAPLEVLRRASPGGTESIKAREIMERQVSHLARLLEDLLDVSRIAQGRLHLRKQDVLLTQVIEQSVEVIRALVEAKRMALTVDLPPHPILLEADPARLCQVFSNLLNNAVKYSPAGARIVLEAKQVGGAVDVTVTDNGIGMDESELPHLFQMFVSAHHGDTKLQDGLGVGLALSRTLVEMHGGTLGATSSGKGMGSCFIVRLPVRSNIANVPAGEAPKEEHISLASRKILVVDDNHDSADSVSLFLEMQGVEVRTAYDGESALRAAVDFRPDAILLDIGLPDIDGNRLARAIRRFEWAQSTILIATTGWGQAADKREAEEAGFDHHLTKPLDLQQLSATLFGLLRNESSPT